MMYKLHIVSVSVDAGHLTQFGEEESPLLQHRSKAMYCCAQGEQQNIFATLRRLSPISYMQQNNEPFYVSVENVLVFVTAIL